MEEKREMPFQKVENTGARGFFRVISHRPIPANRPTVYPNRRSPWHRAKPRYSQA